MPLKDYRELRVWQTGMDLVQEVYRITRGFPGHELYGLASQMQRCAVSIPSNIAEGYTRHHRKEYLQYLAVARASLAELNTQAQISSRLSYVSAEEAVKIQATIESLSKQIYALRESLIDARMPPGE